MRALALHDPVPDLTFGIVDQHLALTALDENDEIGHGNHTDEQCNYQQDRQAALACQRERLANG